MRDRLSLALWTEGLLSEVQVITITFDPSNVILTSHLQICSGRKEFKGKFYNCRDGPAKMKCHKNVHNIPTKEKNMCLSLSFFLFIS